MNDEYQTTATEAATQALVASMMQAALDQMKALPDTWQRMTENDQVEALECLHKGMVQAANQVVIEIAARGSQRVEAEVEQVVFKDGAKAVLKGRGQAFHDIADAVGRTVLIVIPGVEFSLDEPHGIQADKDQGDLNLAA